MFTAWQIEIARWCDAMSAIGVVPRLQALEEVRHVALRRIAAVELVQIIRRQRIGLQFLDRLAR